MNSETAETTTLAELYTEGGRYLSPGTKIHGIIAVILKDPTHGPARYPSDMVGELRKPGEAKLFLSTTTSDGSFFLHESRKIKIRGIDGGLLPIGEEFEGHIEWVTKDGFCF